jgi:perosamine synthetase
MTEVQGAVGLVQLGRLDGLNARRREIADQYTRGLSGVHGLTLPYISPDVEHTFHVYCILLDAEFPLSKEDFMWELYTRYRIKAWSHYMPMHLTTAYRNLGHKAGECPTAEALFDRYVSLPIHPRLTDEAIGYLIASIRALGGAA